DFDTPCANTLGAAIPRNGSALIAVPAFSRVRRVNFPLMSSAIATLPSALLLHFIAAACPLSRVHAPRYIRSATARRGISPRDRAPSSHQTKSGPTAPGNAVAGPQGATAGYKS